MKQRVTRVGTHLFDRHSGLNVLLEQSGGVSIVPSAVPAFVSIALLNACDLECPQCYAPKHRARLQSTDIVEWCRSLDSSGCLGIGFGGGEPTLFPQFARLCQDVATSTELAVTFTTHGHHITEKLATALYGHVHFVRFSWDGIGSIYEDYRKRPFDGVLRSMGIMRPVCRVGVNLLVNGRTLPTLDSACDLAMSAGAGQIVLLPEIRNGRSILTSAEASAFEAWAQRNVERYPLAVSEQGTGTLILPRLFEGCDDGNFCHITADAVVKRSAFDADGISLSGARGVVEAIVALRDVPRSLTL